MNMSRLQSTALILFLCACKLDISQPDTTVANTYSDAADAGSNPATTARPGLEIIYREPIKSYT